MTVRCHNIVFTKRKYEILINMSFTRRECGMGYYGVYHTQMWTAIICRLSFNMESYNMAFTRPDCEML